MPDFGKLYSRERPVAEALYKNHSDWLDRTARELVSRCEFRPDAQQRFIEEVEDYVQRLFDEAGRKISPVVMAALPVKWDYDDRISFEDIGCVLFEEYWPEKRKPAKASKNRKSVGKSGRKS